MASTREVLVAVLVLVSVRASFTRALPALGADETDSCAMTTLVYPDEFRVFVPVTNALTTAAATTGDLEDGFDHRPSAGVVTLPFRASLLPVADPDCNCLSGGYLEMDVQVPHLTTKVTRLVLRDGGGGIVLDVVVPEEQQTRYVLDDDVLVNRIRVELHQSSAPAGNLADVASMSIERAGRADLANIDPLDRPLVYWVVSLLRFRRGCKECGDVPANHRRENAVVALTPPDAVTTLVDVDTAVSVDTVDLTPVIDPGCRCLLPTFDPSKSATLEFEVELHNRNVWPHEVLLVDAGGHVVWQSIVTRAEPSVIDSWQKVSVPLGGRANTWLVGAESAGRHGTMPPWHALGVVVRRKALTGAPALADVPDVRNFAIIGGAPEPAGAYVAYVNSGPVTVTAQAGTTTLAPSPATQTMWRDFAAVLGPDLLTAGGYMTLDSTPSADLAVASVVLVDGAGVTVAVEVPAAEIAKQSAGATVTLWLPLTAASVTPNDNGFDWGAVASVSVTHAGAAAPDVPTAADAGDIVVSRVRVGVPRRLGHVSNPDDYNVDDLACDPLTGWFDSGVFVRHDPVRYSHCRECCCYFDDPGNPVVKHCYEQGDIIAEVTPAEDMAPNDQCAVCDRNNNPQVMSPRNMLLPDGADPPYFTCDDAEPCTWNDRCRDDGACIADLYTTCLVSDFWGGDPSKDCEECDGSGPGSPTLGCKAKEGFYVYKPGTVNRTCACLIDGVLYPHWSLNPLFPCLRCDVTLTNTEWSEVPNDSKCDITKQWDWLNVASQACTYKHICGDGVCRGIGYACPPIQACEAPLDEFPHSCDLSGPASETGGCQRRKLPEGVVCAPQVHGCIPEARCTGIVGTCPPQIELPGIIYEDQFKKLRLRLPDLTDADQDYPVIPSLDAVTAAYDAFRVQCGDLQLRMAIIPNGLCSVARVSDAVGNGWGDSFSPPPRGSFGVLSRQVTVGYVPKRHVTRVTRADRGMFAVGTEDSLLALDSGAGDYTPAVVTEFQAAGVPEPFMDVVYRREHGAAQLGSVELVDDFNRTVYFTLPPVKVVGEWVAVSGKGEEADEGGFDWSSVIGVRLVRDGLSEVDGVDVDTPLFTLRAATLRTRAQAPPCAFAHIADRDGGSQPLEVHPVPEHAGVYNASLPTWADIGIMYDVAQNVFLDDTFLAMEVLSPAAGFAPLEVAILGADGQGVVAGLVDVTVPAQSDDGAGGGGAREWVRVVTSLRAGLLTGGVTDFTFLSVASITVRFDAAVAAAPGAAASAMVRRVHLARGARCAHALESAHNGGLDLFTASSQAPALSLSGMDGTTQLSQGGGIQDIASSAFDLDLSSLTYDHTCACFPGAVLEMDVTSLPWTRVKRLSLLQSSTGLGLQLDLPPPVPVASSDTAVGAPQRGIVSVNLDDADRVTVLGPPELWEHVNVMQMWHAHDAATDTATVGEVLVHAVRVRNTGVPCITTTMLGVDNFETPEGAVASAGREATVAVGDESSGRLVRVTDDGVAGDVERLTSRQRGVWRDGGAGGAAHFTALATVDQLAPGSPIAVTVGTYASTSDASFAGTTLPAPSASANAGVVSGRNSRTGAGAWAVSLGEGTVPAGVAAGLSAAAGERVLAVVVGSTATSAGVAPTVAGTVSATDGAGGDDAFVALIDPSNGAATASAVVGSAGDDAWLAVATNVQSGTDRGLVVVGGTSSGEPASLGVPASDPAPGGGAVALLVAYESADEAAAGDTPRWARAFGHGSDAVTAAVTGVVAGAGNGTVSLVIAAGTYSGGRLRVSDGIELPAPAAGSSGAFMLAVAADTGAVVWARVLSAAVAPGSKPSLGVGAGHGFACVNHGPSSTLTHLLAGTGMELWSSSLLGASCRALVTTVSGSVAVVGSASGVPGTIAGTVDIRVTTPDNTTTTVHRMPAAAGQQGFIMHIDGRTGVWRDGEYFGGTGTAAEATAVALDTHDPAGMMLVAGAASGPLSFGVPATMAFAAPSGDDSSPDTFLARIGASSRNGPGVLMALYRDGGGAEERVTSVLVTATSYVVSGSVSLAAGGSPNPAPVVGGLALDASEVSGGRTTVGTLHSVSKGGSVAFGQSVLGQSWGITGDSAWEGAASADAATVIAAGHFVSSPTQQYITVPDGSGDAIARLANPGTQEPLVAGLDESGDVLWGVTGEQVGSSDADDVVAAIAYSGLGKVAVVVGHTLSDDAFVCSHIYNPARAAGDVCSAATVSALHFADGPRSKPTSASATFIGGDGVSSRATGVVASPAGLVAVTGSFRRDVWPGAPKYLSGVMYVPARLFPVQGDRTLEYTAGEGVALAPPADGSEAGWVALYAGETGRLVWAGLVSGVPTGDHAGARMSAVHLASAALTHGDIVLCGHVAGPGVLVQTSRPTSSAGDTSREPTLTATSDAGTAYWSDEYGERAWAGAPQSFVVALGGPDGTSEWAQFMVGDGAGGATCTTLEYGTDTLVAVGSVSSATSTFLAGDAPALTTSSGFATSWVCQLAPADGDVIDRALLGSRAISPGGSSSRDAFVSAAVDATAGVVVIAGSCAGGELYAALDAGGRTAEAGLSGASARPAIAAMGSSDVVLVGVPLAAFVASSGDMLPQGFALGSSSPSAPGLANARVTVATAAPASGSGLGFASGTSVGTESVMAVGFFKGTLNLDGDGGSHVVVAGAAVAGAGGYDALLVRYRTENGLQVVSTLRLLGLVSNNDDDRFRAVATNPSGSVHYVAGHAVAALAALPVSVGGVDATLPGGGGRDGLLFAVSDVDASVAWVHAVGGVTAGDNALLAVSADGVVIASAGEVSGQVPTYGGNLVYDGAVDSRTLATVYLTAIDGSELWGRAVGTDAASGYASASSVALVPGGSVVAIAGSFGGGSLMIDGVTLECAACASAADRTAFIATLDVTDGDVVWARAAGTGSNPGAGSFSVIRGLAASSAAVVAAGEFFYPGPAYISFGAVVDGEHPEQGRGYPTFASNATAGADTDAQLAVPHGFMVTLQVATGDVNGLNVPQCPAGCRAGGVQVSDGRAWVAYTYQGRAVFSSTAGSSISPVGDPLAPAAHRGALVAYSAVGAESVQQLGATGSGHVDVAAVGVGRRGAVVAAAGWRSGAVRFPNLVVSEVGEDPSLREVGPLGTVKGVALEFQPVVAAFDVAARAPAVISSTSSHTPIAIASGVLTAGSSSPLAGDVPAAAVALGRHIALTGATFRGGSVSTDSSGALRTNAFVTSTDGLLVATDRRSGAELWAWSVAGSDADADDSVVAAGTSPSGALLCAAGTVSDGGNGGLLDLFGVSGAASPHGGGGADGYVACFNDNPDTAVSRAPRFVSVIGSASEQRVTALAVTDAVAWVALQTTGAMSFGAATLAHGSEAGLGAAAPPRCVVAAVSLADGAELTSMVFGSEVSGESCTVTSIVASADGLRLYVGGYFLGTELVLSGGLTLPATSGLKTTGFIAAYDVDGVGGATPTLRFGSVTAFNSPPVGEAAVQVDGMVLAEGGADGGPTAAARLYVTGLYTTDTLVWGGSSGDGAPAVTTATASPAAAMSGAGDPTAVYVAMFDADVGSFGGGDMVAPVWITNMVAETRSGITACGSMVLGAGGRLSLALLASSAVRTSKYGAAMAPLTPPGAASATLFGLVVSLHAYSGAPAGGITVADPVPTATSESQLSVPTLAAATAGASRSAADDLVLVSAARGGAGSSHQRLPDTGIVAPIADGGFVLFVVPLGPAAQSEALSAPLLSTSAAAVSDLVRRPYVVQLDVWSSRRNAVIVGGEWRSAAGSGAGVVFSVPDDLQRAQAETPRTWLTIEAHATPATFAGGRSMFGSIGGDALLGGLRFLSLKTAGSAIDDAARWRVRNVRLVPRVEECVPCGSVPVRVSAISLRRPASAPLPLADGPRLVPMTVVPGDGALPSFQVDASAIVDPSCGCLAGAMVSWDERLPSPAFMPPLPDALDSPVVGAVGLTTPSGEAGVFTTDVEYEEPRYNDRDGADYTWRRGHAFINLEDHMRAAEMDWRAIPKVTFYAHVPLGDGREAPEADVRIRQVTVQRQCPRAAVLLHPRPLKVNSTVDIRRSGLGLKRGNSYRVITYETNMWGDSNVPTCSRDFVADDTPPSVAHASVNDVRPEIGADEEDQEFSRYRVLKVGWSGVFEEPDSAPDNILLFKIVNVTAAAPDGVMVENMLSEEKLLATTSTGHVSTNGLALEDGERYFVHLGVCNRGKLCSTIVSDTGIIHDSSPPESAALHVVPSAGQMVDASTPPVVSHHQINDTAIHASWAPFVDPHTWVEDLRVGLGTADFGTDVHEFRIVPNGTRSVTFPPKAGFGELLKGQPYYVVWWTVNPAGAAEFYRSAPLYIDRTPPDVHWVVDVFPHQVDGIESYFLDNENIGDVDLTDGTIVRAKFFCDDNESVENGVRGNITYRWRVCDTAACDSTIYANWMETGQVPRGVANSSALRAAREAGTLEWVFVEVECTNPVGLSSRGSSNGMLFDATPPNNASATVVEFDPRPGKSRDVATGDVDYLPTDTMLVAWAGFTTDVGRPALLDYQIAIGTAPGVDDVMEFTSVGLATTFTTDADVTPLEHGFTYFVTVEAITTAGASSSVWSDSITFDKVAPAQQVADIAPDQLALDDIARCASHLRCMSVSGAADDVDYLASTLGVSLLISAREAIAPLATVEYGVSTCGPALLDLNLVPMQTAASTSQLRFDHTGVSMFHGQRYCAVVFETAVGGLVGYNASDGVVVDITPPESRVIHEGSSAAVDDDAVSTPNELTVTGRCADIESGIHHAEVMLSQVDFGTGDVIGVEKDWVVVPDTFSPPTRTAIEFTTTLSGLTMAHNEWFVTTLRCVNNAGAYADLDSDGVVLDTTPPEVDDADIRHDLHDVVVRLQTETGVIQASWKGFVDPDSRVASFAWSIGTAPHGTDVMDVAGVGSATSVSSPSLELEDGATYYVTVYATNRAGLVSATASAGITIDSTAPLPPSAIIVHADAGEQEVGWLGSLSRISASWVDAVEPHTNVTYRWALGTLPYGQQVMQWQDVGRDVFASAMGLALLPGMAYYVSVEAMNDAGLRSVAFSQRIRIDPYPPVAGVVVDGATTDSGRRAQTSTDQLFCAWGGFEDQQSAIASYRAGFGTTPGTADLVAYAELPPSANAFSASELTLSTGSRYYCSLLAYDLAGNVVRAGSRGIVVDATPPVAGSVLDTEPGQPGGSSAVDIDFQVDTGTVSASWLDWHDDESGISRVEWAVGTSAGGQQVQQWTHVYTHRTAASIQLAPRGISLEVGTTYYTSVRAYNGAGMVTEASSDGFTILPGRGAGPELPVQVNVLHIPASPTMDGRWCHCGDPSGDQAATGMVYDPASGACSCGPGLYLSGTDGHDLACVTCPAGTCKHNIGNAAEFCTAEACDGGADADLPEPVDVDSLSSCGDPTQGRVTRASDNACVCPPGTRADVSGACVECGAGTVNPWLGDVAECGVCWAATNPDVVLHVSWDMDALAGAGVTPTSLVVSVGTSPGALRWTRTLAQDATWAQFHSRGDADSGAVAGDGHPPFRHGSTLFARVRAIVVDAVVGDQRVVAPVVDFSPPLPGGVTDGPSGGIVDVNVLADGDSVSAAWFDFSDNEWGADADLRYQVAFGTGGQGSSDITGGWLDVGDETSTTITMSPALDDGTFVRATVRAINPAGAWASASSDGAMVQEVIPLGVVAVVPAATAGGGGDRASLRHHPAQADVTSIGAAWQFEASYSGVKLTYTWVAFDVGSGDAITNVTNVGDATWGAAALAEPLQPGHRYAVRVRARNAAGVWREAVSQPTLIDATPPTDAVVDVTRGGGDVEGAYYSDEAAFQFATDSIGVEWTCLDSEATLTNVTVAVGTIVGSDLALPAVTVPYAAQQQEFTGLDLVHGHCYVAQVSCTSDAHLTSTVASSSPVCIDTTAPQATAKLLHPAVRAVDLVTEAGPAPAQAAVKAVMDASAGSGSPLASHVHVAAGRMDAILRGRSAASPVAVSGHLGADALVQVTAGDSESGVTHLDLVWSFVDIDDDGVDAAAVVAGVALDLSSVDLLGRGVVAGNITYAELREGEVAADAPNGTPMYPHWRVFNGAGARTFVSAPAPLVLDTSPPVLEVFNVTHYQMSTTTLFASWACSDDESEIAGYVWGVTDADTGAQVVAPTWLAGSTVGFAENLALQHGASYSVQVTACNLALLCETYVDTVIVDTTAAHGGTVYLGSPDSATVDDLCVNATAGIGCALPPAITMPESGLDSLGDVSWGGFFDDESPIDAYVVALGTSPRGTQAGTVVKVPSSVTSLGLDDLSHADPDVVDAVLYHGATLWVSVTAVNRAGLSATVVAPVLHVDEVAPSAGVVTIVGAHRVTPVVASGTASFIGGVALPHVVLRAAAQMSVTVTWTPFVGATPADDAAESYSVVLIDHASGGVAAGPTTVDPSSSNLTVTWDSLSLDAGAWYMVAVSGVDAAGNRVTAHAERDLVVDGSAPRQARDPDAAGFGLVRDGTDSQRDTDCQPRGGREPLLASSVLTVDARGTNPKIVQELAQVVQVDQLVGDFFLNPAQDPTAATVLHFNFAPFSDDESGVAEVSIALGQLAGGSDVLDWFRIPTQAMVQVVLPILPEGAVVHATVRATNGVGIVAEARSDGVRMLCVPGTPGCDYDGTFVCLSP